MNYVHLSKKIKDLCAARNKSISNMITECGLSKSFIYDLERRNQSPSLKILSKISNYLDVSIGYLLSDENINDLQEVQAELSELFNQEYTLTRYAYYLWESLNELTASHELLSDMLNIKPFNRNSDWVIVFKYCVVTLDEASKVLFLQNDVMKTFESVKEVFFKDSDIKNAYNKAISFWKEKKEYFAAVRNYTVHFDHEKVNYLSNFIKNTPNYTLYESNGYLCDYNNPIYLDVIIQMYKDLFNKDADGETVVNELKELLIYTRHLLSKMFNCFLENYADLKQSNNNRYILCFKPEKNSELEKYSKSLNDAAKSLKRDNRIIDTFHSLDDEGKEKAEQYLELLSLQYDKTTIEDEIDELISALPDKKDNTVTMRIAAFGGGVREVKVSREDLKEVMNSLEEEDDKE